jgi:hypothetical protein
MSYSQKYYFTFYSDRDTRIINGTPDEYSCDISQLDYAGSATEIQAQCIPQAMKGLDLMGTAKTGSGTSTSPGGAATGS